MTNLDFTEEEGISHWTYVFPGLYGTKLKRVGKGLRWETGKRDRGRNNRRERLVSMIFFPLKSEIRVTKSKQNKKERTTIS